MSYTAKQCLERAEECDRMASEAKDRDAKTMFAECAGQWRELARQKSDLPYSN
jgi:hypothetical protein